MQNKTSRLALRVSLIYCFVAGVWILLSDQVLLALVSNTEVFGKVDILKDWAFVAVTAMLLFFFLREAMRKQDIDADKRKQADQILLEKEEQYRKVVEGSTDAIFVMQAGKFALVNPAAVKLFGANRPEELLGRQVFDLIHEDYRKIIQTRVRQAAMQDQALPLLEQKLLRLDGSVIEVEASSVRFQFEGQPAILVEAHDITGRRQAQKIVQEKQAQVLQEQARLRALIDSIPDLIFFKDKESVFLGCNKAFEVHLGIKEGDMVGKTDFELIPRELAEAYRKNDREMLSSGKTQHKEEWIPSKNGGGGLFETLKTPYYGAQGEMLGLIGVSRDITNRKLAEKKVRQLSQAVEQSPVSVVITNPNGQIEYVNHKFTEVTGYSFEEALGKNPRILKSGELSVETYKQLWSRIANGGTWSGEFHNRKKNGELFWEWATISPILDADGKITHFLAVKEDITQRKLVEESLRASEERFRLLTENASDIITVINGECLIRFISPSVERTLGYKTDELTNRNGFEFIHPEDAAHAATSLQRALNEPGLPVSIEFRFRHRDGTWHVLQSVGKSIPNQTSDGFIVINSRDITENRKLEAQLRQSQKMEAIGQLAGGVAHDFNNILAVIQMQAGLLEATGSLLPTQQDYCKEIGKATQRAANLTRQLLLFSRKQTLELRDLDLSSVITNITKMLQRILGEDVHLQLNFAPESLFIHADAGMLDQILVNLAVNSRDAMPKGGRLIIETAAVKFDALTATQSPQARPGSFACLSVSDTGCGISPEILPRIFEPFFTTKDVGKGTGLGLATVFGIVQQHQGWINVYSEVGHGTTFRIYLPRLARTAADTSVLPALTSLRGGKETILLVEDESSLCALVQRILSHLGYRVLEAPTSFSALEIWKHHRDEINLLLTDLILPDGMNGKELSKRLLQDNPKLKVIYTSGYSADIAGKDLLLHQGVNFLAKPFEAHKLAEIVRVKLDS